MFAKDTFSNPVAFNAFCNDGKMLLLLIVTILFGCLVSGFVRSRQFRLVELFGLTSLAAAWLHVAPVCRLSIDQQPISLIGVLVVAVCVAVSVSDKLIPPALFHMRDSCTSPGF